MYFMAVEYLLYHLKNNKKWLEIIKWFSTFCICVSALMVSVSIEMSMMPEAFYGFLIAHILWTFAGVVMRDYPIIVLNGFFIFIDTYAIITRL